jgi:hypothetical protein
VPHPAVVELLKTEPHPILEAKPANVIGTTIMHTPLIVDLRRLLDGS